MKKLYLCVFFCLCIFCMGRGKKYMQDTENVTDVESSSVKREVKQVTESQSCYTDNTIADDGCGYYFTYGMNGRYYRIYYYDENCERAVPLCSKVNCRHTGSDCGAYYTMKRDEQGKLTAIEGNGFEGNDLSTVAFDDDRNMYIYKGVTGEVSCYRLDTVECTKIYDNGGYGNVIHYDDGFLYLD